MKPASRFAFTLGLPPMSVAVFVVAMGMVDAAALFVRHVFASVGTKEFGMPELTMMRASILTGSAIFYALYRVFRFHPIFNVAYAEWLRISPWTPNKPLPLGPVHPVWRDAMIVGILTALAKWHADINPFLPLLAFGSIYFGMMTMALVLTGTWTPALLLGFLWAALALPIMRGLPTVFIVAAIIVTVLYGYRESLQRFPWRLGKGIAKGDAGSTKVKSVLHTQVRITPSPATGSFRSSDLGWPLQWLSPKLENNPIPTRVSACLSTLIGWWTYCLIVAGEMPCETALLLLFAGTAASIRLFIYCCGMAPPFNIWGRLARGRIIIPGYDWILATPVVAFLIALVGGSMVPHSGDWQPEIMGATVALVCFALLNGGPSLRRWVLTGQHRFQLSAANQKFVKQL